MNIFTNDDYRRIQAWLKANAIKDSEFAISENTVPDKDILVITQNMSTVPTNYRIKIKDLLNSSLGKVVIDKITANIVKVNNSLTIDASKVILNNEKGTTLQDVLDCFEENKLNRHTDDIFDGNLTVKKNITIEGNIKSYDDTITVESDLEATGEITDGQGNMLSDVNDASKGWKIEYQDPQQDEPTVRAKYVLKDYRGVPKGNVIKIYKDSAITNVYLGTVEDTCNPNTGEVTKYPIHDNNEALSIVYRLDTGKYSLVNVPIKIFTTEAEFDKYKGLGVTENGQVFVKLASDVESSNYLHFNDSGELSADGIENRILRDLGTIINSVANDGTMWGQYKKEEGTKDSPINEASRWGQYKQAEAKRSELLNTVSSKIDTLKNKIDSLALGAFYGYFPDSESLPIDVTTSGYAYVGLDNPYKIWNFNGESWSDSSTSIDMNDADEEDITRNIEGKLQLKDRVYGDGMGYIILRKNKSFAEQITKENTIYEIRYDFTLEKNITIPANCVLKFEGGSIKGSYTLTGQNTVIDNTTTPIFDGIIIQGTWNNKASYLSWFADSDDYSEQIVYLSLLSKKVYLNKSGNLKGRSLIKKEVEIDGCNNIFYIYINDTTTQTYDYNTLDINCQNTVSIYNINFVYSQVITNTQSRSYNCLCISNKQRINQFINIHNVTIKNFDNRNTNPCQFRAIMVNHFDEGNSCNIHDIIIENCINLGDGVAITGAGGISGIRVQVSPSAKATGVGNIYNITINKLANCKPDDHENLRIIEDCNGIYICAVPGIYGMDTQININIHDCYFTDVAERCFKIQGKNASIKNIYNKFTTKIINEIEVPIVYQSCIINMQGANLFAENIYGEIYNEIVHCAGGQCIIKNSILKRPYPYFGSELIVDSDNAILENCEISVLQPVRSIFYGRKNQDYTIKNCKITLSNGAISSASSLSDYSSTNIQIENTYIDGLSGFIEYNTKIISKLILKDTFLGIKEFGQMVHNCDIIDSKITCRCYFNSAWDHSEQTIKINNSEFIYTRNATTELSFPTNSKINLENTIFTNNSAQEAFKIVFKIPNGTKEAILNNIKYNKIYNGINLVNFEISNGSGNIEFKRNENTPITSFTVINEETPINPLSISYNSNFNPNMSAMQYISTSTRVLKVSNLDFIGKDSVTYYYNNKNVYYRNKQWVDAIGTPI